MIFPKSTIFFAIFATYRHSCLVISSSLDSIDRDRNDEKNLLDPALENETPVSLRGRNNESLFPFDDFKLMDEGNQATNLHMASPSFKERHLAAAWSQLGEDIDGEAAYDFSGEVSLSSDGLRIAVGAAKNDGNGLDAGHVRVYDYDPYLNAWSQVGQDINGEAELDQSGRSVALSGDGTRVAIGAPKNDDGSLPCPWTDDYKYADYIYTYNDYKYYEDDYLECYYYLSSGQVRVYELVGITWSQVGQDIDGTDGNDNFGHSVSISDDGSRIAVGAVGYIGDAGYVRVYDLVANFWTQVGSDIVGEAANDSFGESVSLTPNGARLAVGAPGNDGNGRSRISLFFRCLVSARWRH